MADITTSSTIPAGKPIEIQRFEDSKELWKAWIDGDTVVWMESAGPAAKTGLAYSASADWDTMFRFESISGGDAQEVPGVRLSAPKIPGETPWGLTLPLVWAALLPAGTDAPAELVWAAPPPVLSDSYLFHGMWSWSPGETPLELLPESSVSLSAQASGDAIAIPVPLESVSGMSDDSDDPANWDKLRIPSWPATMRRGTRKTEMCTSPTSIPPARPRCFRSGPTGIRCRRWLWETTGW